MADSASASSRLRQIADALRNLQLLAANEMPGYIARAANVLVEEALTFLSGSKWLQIKAEAEAGRAYGDFGGGTFAQAVRLLGPDIYGSSGASWPAPGCGIVADAIDAEAERLAKTEQGEGDGGAGSTRRPPKPRRRKRKPDPKKQAKRKEREAQAKIDKAIETEWGKGEWDTLADYATWKNEYLPDGWPQLDRFYVQKAVGRVRRKRRYAKK
jgi:hypothetical protein